MKGSYMTFNFSMVSWDEDSIPKGAYIYKEVTDVWGHRRFWAIDINTTEELVALMDELKDRLIISKGDKFDGDFEQTITVENDYLY